MAMGKSTIKKQKAFRAVKFEIEMFHKTHNLQKKFFVAKNKDLERISILSFGIHFRNLFYFFYVPKKYDDITIDDYLNPNQKKYFLSNRINESVLRKFEKETNKRITHLTYSRLEYKKAGKDRLDADKIYTEMNKTIQAFNEALNK